MFDYFPFDFFLLFKKNIFLLVVLFRQYQNTKKLYHLFLYYAVHKALSCVVTGGLAECHRI